MVNKIDDARRFSLLAAGVLISTVVAGAMMIPRDADTQTPVELGISQPPLVTIIFDTSGSMQWGGSGEEDYPVLPDSEYSGAYNHLETWVPGTPLNLGGSMRNDGSQTIVSQDDIGVRTVGPCMVWAPGDGDGDGTCEKYERPGTCSELNGKRCNHHGYDIEYTDMMESRLGQMRAEGQFRLNDQANTPRHILVKQILAGDMIMRDNEGNAGGPGCWFVPRSRGAQRDEQVCCNEVNSSGRCIDDASKDFEEYIDYQDPVPHYQEVYDERADNGLIAAMSSTTIFSTVMFDSYRYDGVRTNGWQFPMDSILGGQSPYISEDIPEAHMIPNPLPGYEGKTCASGECYNMGFFRFIGPSRLELSDDEMRAVGAYTQAAILDAGLLFEPDFDGDFDGDGDGDGVLNPSWRNEDGINIPAPVYPYPLGKQPIAQSTPLAGVFHDLHQFYRNGQENEATNEVVNPFDDATDGDRYLGCRGRHVVLFTDADEILEVPGGAGDGIGSENLREEFGFRSDRYPYLLTEHAIELMVESAKQQMIDALPPGGTLSPRHTPRVHVLSVAKQEDINDTDLWGRMVDKMAALAEAGQTCAQYYLPPEMIPTGINTRGEDEDGNSIMVPGTCDFSDSDTVCLVPQNRSFYTYNPPTDESENFLCEHPALMLTRNDRRTMVRAFQAIFNEIASASGLSARTRPSITNYLDDDTKKGGQYRIYSGLQIDGSNRYWKGIMNRQLLECADPDLSDPNEDVLKISTDIGKFHDDFEHLRVEIGQPLDSGDVSSDRRRIFTSVPLMLKDESGNLDFTGESGEAANSFFNHTYQLLETTTDVFGAAYEFASGSSTVEPKTRVNFEYDDLHHLFTDSSFLNYDANEFTDYWNISPGDTGLTEPQMFELVVDRYRGRIAEKADRVLGGIFNSNPATVGPPDMDIPVDSYRAFRVEYSQRPAMTYVSSVDGLLSAIYSGEPQVMARKLDGGSVAKPADMQREAWAYIPQLIHGELASKWETAHQLMDGSPVVTDIRLCHSSPSQNANKRICPNDGVLVSPADQWRTVLAQGLGSSGPGYFALDVTRAGDDSNVPDPIVLWEFGPEWERSLLASSSLDSWRSQPSTSSATSDYEGDLSSSCKSEIGGDEKDMWNLSFLGASVAEPALGTVAMALDSNNTVQRPIALFGGGSRSDNNSPVHPSCAGDVTGKAIYVVDLQSGDLIRRFVDYTDESDSRRFSDPVSGAPALSSTLPGEASSRAFIGDDGGRLFRVNMSKIDPKDWEVELFFDPANSSIADDGDVFGPAAFRPAMATGTDRELVVIYGLGQRGDTGDRDTLQAIIALEEKRDLVNNTIKEAKELWTAELALGERLTGEPVVFNGDVFFTTYSEDPAQACLAGEARIYRLQYDDGTGGWDDDSMLDDFDVETNGRYFAPKEPSLIRGLAITMGPQCNLSDGPAGTITEPPAQQPQLLAQAGGADVGDGGGGLGGGTGGDSGGDISRIVVDLERPQTRTIPLSWSVIGN